MVLNIPKEYLMNGETMSISLNKQDILDKAIQLYDYNTIIEDNSNISELDYLQEDCHEYSIIILDNY